MPEGLLADRYRLGDLLGTGGVAEVRRARDTLLGRDVAIKLFRDMDVRRFDNEIRTLAGLSHPGLVSVYDADTTGDLPFMVLELVEGKTLRDRVANGRLPVEDVRRLGAAVADALAHVHANGFIHRDIKPSNILLDDGNVPRLADFGLALTASGARLTRTGQVVGTAAYLAPEQVRGAEITPAVDVYALGLVLLECLTGHREYGGGEIEAAVARLHRPPAVPADLPFDLARLLSLMTALSAGRRPTARECADVLSAKDPRALDLPTNDPPTKVAPLPRRPRRVLAAASVAVLMAAVGSGIAARDRVPAPPAATPPVSTEPGTAEPIAEEPVAEEPVVERPVVPTTAAQPPERAGQQPKVPGKDKNGKGNKGKP